MDEAERCHGLAILAEGRVVAEGTPRDLMHGVEADVFEIEGADGSDGRECMRATALGARRDAARRAAARARRPRHGDASEQAAHRCSSRQASTRASTPHRTPVLEDVFVVATRRARSMAAESKPAFVARMLRLTPWPPRKCGSCPRDRVTFGMIVGVPLMQITLFGYAINYDVRNLATVVQDQAIRSMSREFVAHSRPRRSCT
jgi:hypothetical protein